MDNKFFVFMGRVADLMILNILCIICCIPIITIGASVTAMYYVTLKMTRNEESYIVRSFFKSFKENFKQATVIWLVALADGLFRRCRFCSHSQCIREDTRSCFLRRGCQQKTAGSTQAQKFLLVLSHRFVLSLSILSLFLNFFVCSFPKLFSYAALTF